MNASPAMDTGGPLLVLRRHRDAARPAAGRARCRSTSCGPGRDDDRRAGRAADRGDAAARRARDRQRLRPARVPAPDGDRRRRRHRRRELDGDVVRAARIAITALAPTIRRVPEAEAALTGAARRPRPPPRPRPPRRPPPPRRSPTSAARAEYRRAMARVITRRAITAAVARARDGAAAVPVPASPALHGAV